MPCERLAMDPLLQGDIESIVAGRLRGSRGRQDAPRAESMRPIGDVMPFQPTIPPGGGCHEG